MEPLCAGKPTWRCALFPVALACGFPLASGRGRHWRLCGASEQAAMHVQGCLTPLAPTSFASSRVVGESRPSLRTARIQHRSNIPSRRIESEHSLNHCVCGNPSGIRRPTGTHAGRETSGTTRRAHGADNKRGKNMRSVHCPPNRPWRHPAGGTHSPPACSGATTTRPQTQIIKKISRPQRGVM